MKISDTDNYFWKLVGDICHFDLDVDTTEYDGLKDVFTLIAPGEKLIVSRKELNRMFENQKEFDYIRFNWKTGNQFDGKIEKEEK